MLLGKRPSIDASAVHHDIAPAHSAQSTELEIDVIGFQRLSHHPENSEFCLYGLSLLPESKITVARYSLYK
ncbi:hypothetical protein DPMN_115226 [Dreissena polymorpha]|uniref:Uncharacterized protein n=1 Tax=Dreissena polymorpha TaxID=45954 RepID=A0A9D4KKW1_DREPO|nr:hypothetical protein DPMN_115226 [Dreissena polymorpha]